MAYTLQAALDIACGSREMFLHAEIMRSSITTTCRRLHLLRASKPVDWSDSTIPAEDRWKTYIEDEGRRRLGWGIYVSVYRMDHLMSASRRPDGCSTGASVHDVHQRGDSSPTRERYGLECAFRQGVGKAGPGSLVVTVSDCPLGSLERREYSIT